MGQSKRYTVEVLDNGKTVFHSRFNTLSMTHEGVGTHIIVPWSDQPDTTPIKEDGTTVLRPDTDEDFGKFDDFLGWFLSAYGEDLQTKYGSDNKRLQVVNNYLLFRRRALNSSKEQGEKE